jgi:hypothetical protein
MRFNVIADGLYTDVPAGTRLRLSIEEGLNLMREGKVKVIFEKEDVDGNS